MAPSPFNAVKLELALILVLIVPVWLVSARLASATAQLVALALFANTAAFWLWLRIRRVVRRAGQERNHGITNGEKQE